MNEQKLIERANSEIYYEAENIVDTLAMCYIRVIFDDYISKTHEVAKQEKEIEKLREKIGKFEYFITRKAKTVDGAKQRFVEMFMELPF